MLHRHVSTRKCGRSSAPMRALLLCLTVMLCVALFASSTAHAAARNSRAVAHLGDVVPITMYIRLKRQITSPYLFGGIDDDAEAQVVIDDGVVVEDDEGNVVDEDEKTGATQLPDELNLQDLQLPSFGAATSKHSNQVVRTLPPAYAPRFGINRAVTIVADGALRAAGKTLEESDMLQQSDLAMRFSVGRGLEKESTWLPLASRHKFVSIITEMFASRLGLLRAMEKEGEEREELEAAFADEQRKRDDPAVHYLSRVTFHFGYQTGELQKLTSFGIDVQYSPKVRPGIELHYIWEEHRPYNPNRALVLCSAASLLVTMMLTIVVLHPSSRSMLLFSQRIVAVRAHD